MKTTYALRSSLVFCLIISICSCSRRNAIKVVENHRATQPAEAASAPPTRPSAPTTRARKLAGLKLGPELTRDQVIAVWGPPDGDRGFGMPYEAYTMADGRELWFLFSPTPPNYLAEALLVSPQSGQHKILFGGGRYK